MTSPAPRVTVAEFIEALKKQPRHAIVVFTGLYGAIEDLKIGKDTFTFQPIGKNRYQKQEELHRFWTDICTG